MSNYNTPHNKGKSIVSEYIDDIILKITEGHSLMSACEEIGVKYNSAYAYVKKNNITIPKTNNAKISKQRLRNSHIKFDIDKDKLNELYHTEKLNLYEISEIYNVSAATVLNGMKYYDIPRRTKSEAGLLLYNNNPELREVLRQHAYRLKIGNKDTWIELAFKDWANNNNIDISPQFIITEGKHNYDFLIDGTNIIIETDGLYWHTKPDQMLKDRQFEKEAKSSGYIVLRFTDKEIEETNSQCFEEIKQWLK